MHTSAAEIKMIGIDIFMLYSILSKGGLLSPVTFAVSFLMAFFAKKYFMKLLPKDQGRKLAVNGALSEGKPRGAGIIMTTVFVLCSALFAPFSLETALYMVLIYAAMLTGYFDDAAENPWGVHNSPYEKSQEHNPKKPLNQKKQPFHFHRNS